MISLCRKRRMAETDVSFGICDMMRVPQNLGYGYYAPVLAIPLFHTILNYLFHHFRCFQKETFLLRAN